MTRRVNATIAWGEIAVDVRADATLDLRHQGAWIASLGIRWREPWRAESPRVDLDEVIQEVRAPGGRAVVRHVFGGVWHLTIECWIERDAELPAPALVAREGPASRGLPWMLGAGILGRLIIWCADDQALALTQTDGQARPDNGADGPVLRCWREKVIHGPAHLLSRWRCEPPDSVAAVRAHLPAWLPETTSAQAGEEIVVELPDAAVVQDGTVFAMSAGDHASHVVIGEGSGFIEVETARGPVVLDTWGSRGISAEVTRRAGRALRADPRRCSGEQLWLAVHDPAAAAGDAVHAAAEEVLAREARSRRPDPWGVAAAALLLAGDLDTTDILEIAGRWHAVAMPGAWLAAGWLRQILGIGVADPATGNHPLDTLERAVVTGDPRGVEDAVGWAVRSLGSGLPGTPGALGSVARAAGLLDLTPPQWRGPFADVVPELVTSWQHRILTGRDEEIVWLLG